MGTQLSNTTMNNRLAERSRDFLSALARLEEALAQPEDSFCAMRLSNASSSRMNLPGRPSSFGSKRKRC